MFYKMAAVIKNVLLAARYSERVEFQGILYKFVLIACYFKSDYGSLV